VTFEYDGTGFVQMNDIHISGFKQFTTYSAAVETSFTMMKAFGLLPADFSVTHGPEHKPVL